MIGRRISIRAARPDDGKAIADLVNPLIRDTAITFSSEEKTADVLSDAINAAPGVFIVAERAGQVVGYATYAQFRANEGYAHTMEHSIALSPDARGLGVGRALMAAIEAHAKEAGVLSLIAGISGENPAGIAFHTSIGFTQIAVLPKVGRKFGRLMDLVLMQKFL